jgi:hypothetical protein
MMCRAAVAVAALIAVADRAAADRAIPKWLTDDGRE